MRCFIHNPIGQAIISRVPRPTTPNYRRTSRSFYSQLGPCQPTARQLGRQLGRQPIAKQLFLYLLACPLLLLLGGCQESAADSTNAVTEPPRVIDTADVDAPTELTIVAPAGRQPDNSAFIQVAENSLDVTRVAAKDIPGSQLVYRLQDGQDMDKFVLDETTGALSFKQLPDWETPHDADSNNNYMVLWQALSSTGTARSQFLVIQVTDLPE